MTEIEVVRNASEAIEIELEAKPPKNGDGTYKYDSMISGLLKGVLPSTTDSDRKSKLVKLVQIAWDLENGYYKAKGIKRGDWNGYMLIRSFLENLSAYATPGFANAREYMS